LGLWGDKEMKEIFTKIYRNFDWHSSESVSGRGSTIKNTQIIAEKFINLLHNLNIHSLLDIPCGDFNWMRTVNLQGIKYIGCDIVENLIRSNRIKYSTKNIRFLIKDITKDKLPTVDMILIRDCFVHFSDKDIFESFANLRLTKSKYVLTTSFMNTKINRDITTGKWRPINLTIQPFNRIPLLSITEHYCDYGKKYIDKSLLLYNL